jgi:hypothetical protein
MLFFFISSGFIIELANCQVGSLCIYGGDRNNGSLCFHSYCIMFWVRWGIVQFDSIWILFSLGY